MTFLAPWALAIGAVGAASLVALHLVSRHRPAAYVLPTTRFIPDHQSLVSRAATTPSDLLLLILRVLLLMSAATAFARPVLEPRKGSVAQIILVDRSGAVADVSEVAARLKQRGESAAIVVFDTAATDVDPARIDSAMGIGRPAGAASLSAALVVARRRAVALAEDVDSVRLVLVSPVAAQELDSAAPVLRGMWPGAIRIERVAMRVDTARSWSLQTPLPLRDPLGPAVSSLRSHASDMKTRLVRGSLVAADSAFARDGGTVVRWDTTLSPTHAAGLSSDGDVIVASLARRAVPETGRVLARWADGPAAATETDLGRGCIREVGVGLPVAGDLPLHPPFQRIVRRLLVPCGFHEPLIAADSTTMRMLAGTGDRAAIASALRNDEHRASTLVQLLLLVALICVLAELYIRNRPARAEVRA